MAFPWVKYNFEIDGAVADQILYGRYWANVKPTHPKYDECLDFRPAAIHDGTNPVSPATPWQTAVGNVLDTAASVGGYVWLRMTYNAGNNGDWSGGPGSLGSGGRAPTTVLPPGAPKRTVNGRNYLDISTVAGRNYAVAVETILRDYIDSHPNGDRFLVIDSGASGWLQEINFPSTDWSLLGWSNADLATFHNTMVGVWGAKRMCSNMGGNSTIVDQYRAAVGASGIQCLRQDAFGPSSIGGENRAKMYNACIAAVGYLPLCINLEVHGGGSCTSGESWLDQGAPVAEVESVMDDHTVWTGMTGGQPNAGTFPTLFLSDMGCNPIGEYGATYTNHWYNRWNAYAPVTLFPAWLDHVLGADTIESRVADIEAWIVAFSGNTPPAGTTEQKVGFIEDWITDKNGNTPIAGTLDVRVTALENWIASFPI